jgi:hypothetical protein
MNQTPITTMADDISWHQIGMRKELGLSSCEQPKTTQLARMEPMYLLKEIQDRKYQSWGEHGGQKGAR